MDEQNHAYLPAWRAVATSHAAITNRVQKAFASADLPPLSWFEVLSAIERSPTGRPCMSELAKWLTLSRGGITKLVDRLVEADYIERVSCTGDRRSLHAELTQAGNKMLNEMQSIFERELAHYFSALTTKEAEFITTSLEKVSRRTCEASLP